MYYKQRNKILITAVLGLALSKCLYVAAVQTGKPVNKCKMNKLFLAESVINWMHTIGVKWSGSIIQGNESYFHSV